jgi:hypothetical protein
VRAVTPLASPPVCSLTPLLWYRYRTLCAVPGFGARGAVEAGATSRLCTLVCPCRSPRRWASAASLPARRLEMPPGIRRSNDGVGDRRRQTMSPLSPVWSEALPGVKALIVRPTRASVRVSIGAGLQVRGSYPTGSNPGCVSRRARVSGVGHSAGAWACAAGGIEKAGSAAGRGRAGCVPVGHAPGAPPRGGVWSRRLVPSRKQPL